MTQFAFYNYATGEVIVSSSYEGGGAIVAWLRPIIASTGSEATASASSARAGLPPTVGLFAAGELGSITYVVAYKRPRSVSE